ncbi:Spo0B domain-containing protein [Vagococcus fessus]|uniref:Uncharacterized protein n=1 Tax=Vagococcus fessus TaxID=120370 RepID=A0A430A9E6_9ENTE|nr:Spo0B domain-containing protein [Vagococcus fessus]RSU03681.1 hypothetical protein CBF31_08190 [Vagococcus fessus]
MKLKQLNLWLRLTFLVFIALLFTLSFSYYQINKQLIYNSREKQEQDLLKIGHLLSKNSIIINSLEDQSSNSSLLKETHNAEEAFNLDFVVVMTMDKIRLSHPDHEKIYKKFQGGDEKKAIKFGVASVSTASGTLGESLRGFVPVFNNNGKEIGVISIGLTTNKLSGHLNKMRKSFSISLLISLAVSIIAAIFTAYTIKKQMHDLEPNEIAILLEERNAMFENVHDSIIVTDSNNKITLANNSGKLLLKKLAHTDSPYSHTIDSLIPKLQSHTQDHNYQSNSDELLHQNGIDYLISTAPIVVRKKNVGKIFIIRDMTQLISLHDQLQNTTTYATSLQSQSHDFLNKLHVIYGLTDLKDYDQLTKYLEKILEPEQEFASRMVYLIKNPLIAGFLIGERSRFVENQFPFMVEISPDIPTTIDQSSIQIWISMIKYINSHILKINCASDTQIRLGYLENNLETSYSFLIDALEVDTLKKQLNSTYFKNALLESNSSIHYETQSEWFILSIKTPYETTKENK